MLKFLPAILFFCLSVSVYPQNKLKIVKTDSAKIRILNGLSAQIYNFDLKTAQEFAEQILAFAKKNKLSEKYYRILE